MAAGLSKRLQKLWDDNSSATDWETNWKVRKTFPHQFGFPLTTSPAYFADALKMFGTEFSHVGSKITETGRWHLLIDDIDEFPLSRSDEFSRQGH